MFFLFYFSVFYKFSFSESCTSCSVLSFNITAKFCVVYLYERGASGSARVRAHVTAGTVTEALRPRRRRSVSVRPRSELTCRSIECTQLFRCRETASASAHYKMFAHSAVDLVFV